MSDKVCEKSKKYELVAPDGGWGYMICLSFIINCGSVTMFIGCFGMLYNDFMTEIGMNSTAVTLLTGLNAVCFATSGFLTSSLLKLMSTRKLCMLSLVTHDTGALGMVFIKSIPGFFLCQGILMGTGLGIAYNLSCSILNDYFVKRRMFAFSLVQFFVALITMFAPMFVKWSLMEYGFRGTLLLIAGLMLHNIFGVILMQPVKLHMKRIEVTPIAEMQPLLVGEKSNTIPTVKLSDQEKAISASVEKVNEIIIEHGKKSALRRVVDAFIDVSFAKKFIMSCACIGLSICTFADGTFGLILPQALYALGWSQDRVALAISTYGFGDLAMRTVLIFASKWVLMIGTQEVYVIGIILACVSRLGMLWSENPIAIFFYISVMGIARCSIVVLITVVISEVVSPENFTQAMGIFMLFSGLTFLILGPAIGAIRDLTDSYNTAFYLLTSCFAIIALFWSIELCYKKNKEKRKLQKENLEKIKSSRLNKGK